MVTCRCPPLVVIGIVEFTQLAGLKSRLSCRTQPVKVAGQEKLTPLPLVGGKVSDGCGLKFASKVWSARALKVAGFTAPAGKPSSVHSLK